MRSFAEAYPDFAQPPAANTEATHYHEYKFSQSNLAKLTWHHHITSHYYKATGIPIIKKSLQDTVAPLTHKHDNLFIKT